MPSSSLLSKLSLLSNSGVSLQRLPVAKQKKNKQTDNVHLGKLASLKNVVVEKSSQQNSTVEKSSQQTPKVLNLDKYNLSNLRGSLSVEKNLSGIKVQKVNQRSKSTSILVTEDKKSTQQIPTLLNLEKNNLSNLRSNLSVEQNLSGITVQKVKQRSESSSIVVSDDVIVEKSSQHNPTVLNLEKYNLSNLRGLSVEQNLSGITVQKVNQRSESTSIDLSDDILISDDEEDVTNDASMNNIKTTKNKQATRIPKGDHTEDWSVDTEKALKKLKKTVKCEICAKTVVEIHLKHHKKFHTDRVYRCCVCNKGYLSKKQLSKHKYKKYMWSSSHKTVYYKKEKIRSKLDTLIMRTIGYPQHRILMRHFEAFPFLTKMKANEIRSEAQIPNKLIQTWFLNRREKLNIAEDSWKQIVEQKQTDLKNKQIDQRNKSLFGNFSNLFDNSNNSVNLKSSANSNNLEKPQVFGKVWLPHQKLPQGKLPKRKA